MQAKLAAVSKPIDSASTSTESDVVPKFLSMKVVRLTLLKGCNCMWMKYMTLHYIYCTMHTYNRTERK